MFYYGTLLGEQWRALPLYTALGKEHNVDCLDPSVSAHHFPLTAITTFVLQLCVVSNAAVHGPGHAAQRELPGYFCEPCSIFLTVDHNRQARTASAQSERKRGAPCDFAGDVLLSVLEVFGEGAIEPSQRKENR